jgi:hypothetical protein
MMMIMNAAWYILIKNQKDIIGTDMDGHSYGLNHGSRRQDYLLDIEDRSKSLIVILYAR